MRNIKKYLVCLEGKKLFKYCENTGFVYILTMHTNRNQNIADVLCSNNSENKETNNGENPFKTNNNRTNDLENRTKIFTREPKHTVHFYKQQML